MGAKPTPQPDRHATEEVRRSLPNSWQAQADRLVAAAVPVLAELRLLLAGTGLTLTLCDAAGGTLLAECHGAVTIAVQPIRSLQDGLVWGSLELAGAVGGLDLALAAPLLCAAAHAVALRLAAAASSAVGPPAAAPTQRLPGEPQLVGSNPAWLAALDRAARAARTDATILVTGETGTGKELLARAIHRASTRSSGPFLAVNCGALPPGLAVSELFGYVGGAFTGANPRGSHGKIEAAGGGTLFLDEVGELSPEAQIALLRMLQEREIVRVGGTQPVPVDVRVIAATNRSLEALVAAGSFRQDLFFRVNVVPLRLPPLRERREDILPLVEYAYRRLGAVPPELGRTSWDRLTAHPWPGNARELLNLVEQAVALQENPADLLPLPPLALSERPTLGEAGEEERIRQALEACGGNAAATARSLGMGRSTLYRKLELYGIRLKRQVD